MPIEDDGMAGVAAALRTCHHGDVCGQEVGDFALAFVAPLRADDDGNAHESVPPALMIVA